MQPKDVDEAGEDCYDCDEYISDVDSDNNESDHFCGDGDGSKDGEWRLCKWVDSALKASQLYV